MDTSIGERLKAYREMHNLSMANISAATGLPEARLYKWEKGTTPSDYRDVQKMEQLFSGNLESVPREKVQEHTEKEILLILKLNKEYEDRIAELKQRMANVDQLMANLAQMSENQALIEARIELAVDLLIEVHPTLRKIKDPEQAAHALDMRLAPKIEKALKRGSRSGATGTASRS